MSERIDAELILFALLGSARLPLPAQRAIAALDSPALLGELAASSQTSPQLLAELHAAGKLDRHLLSLARNQATPVSVLALLLESASSGVVLAAALHPALHPALEPAPHSSASGPAAAATAPVRARALARLVELGPGVCSPTLLDPFLASETLSSYPELFALWSPQASSQLRQLLALHPQLPPELAQAWAHEDLDLVELIAQNPALAPDLLGRPSLASDALERTRAALSCADLDPTHLSAALGRALAEASRYPGVQMLLATSPQLSQPQLERLLRLVGIHGLVAVSILERLAAQDRVVALSPATLSELRRGAGFWFASARSRPRFGSLLDLPALFVPVELHAHLGALLPDLVGILGESASAWSAWVALLSDLSSSDLLMIARVAASCEPAASSLSA